MGDSHPHPPAAAQVKSPIALDTSQCYAEVRAASSLSGPPKTAANLHSYQPHFLLQAYVDQVSWPPPPEAALKAARGSCIHTAVFPNCGLVLTEPAKAQIGIRMAAPSWSEHLNL